jgi:ketosteroid isomerase-like protein
VTTSDQEKIRIAKEYFLRADQGRPELFELFHEGAEIYFPKFGFEAGPGAFGNLVAGFAGQLEFIQHDYEGLMFLCSGDCVVVEGTSRGRMLGKEWEGCKTPGGRFCNVFRFREGRIASVHIYLDPDYTGDDAARFRWGKDRRW